MGSEKLKGAGKAMKIMKRLAFLLFLGIFCPVISVNGQNVNDSRFGQYNPETGMRDNAILPYETYGRFGAKNIRGPLIRTYPNSRFSDNGALYDAKGRWIGVAGNAGSSRFKQTSSDEFYQTQRDNLGLSDPTASATPPAASYEQPTPPAPGVYIDPRFRPVPQPRNVLAERTLAEAATGSEQPQTQPAPASEQLQRQPPIVPRFRPNSQWFRAPALRGPAVPAASPTPTAQPNGLRTVGEAAPLEQAPVMQPILPPPPEATANLNRNAVRKFELSLEEMILRSPDVHLLSAVAVKYENGTATISGLVTTKEAITKAGEILLTARGVKKVVNNLTSADEE